MDDQDSMGEREEYAARAQELGLPFIDLTRVAADPAAVGLVPGDVAKRHHVQPVRLDADTSMLWVATADIGDAHAMDELRMASGCRIRPVLAVPGALDEAIRRNYG